MGTSGAYGGSGGRDWSSLQRELDRWLDELPGGEHQDGDNQDVDSPGRESPADEAPDSAVLQVLRPLRRALGRGGGGGGGNGAGLVGGRRGRGGRSPSGSGRSRTRAARVGGRVAAGVSALRTGDATALRAFDLDLAELESLDPYAQARRIIEAATEESVATTLEEEEIRTAATRTAIWGLTEPVAPSAQEVVRRFIEEYVYAVFLTEGGTVLRTGARDGVTAVHAEDRVRRTITALVRAAPIERDSLDTEELEAIAGRVLAHTLQIHGAIA